MDQIQCPKITHLGMAVVKPFCSTLQSPLFAAHFVETYVGQPLPPRHQGSELAGVMGCRSSFRVQVFVKISSKKGRLLCITESLSLGLAQKHLFGSTVGDH